MHAFTFHVLLLSHYRYIKSAASLQRKQSWCKMSPFVKCYKSQMNILSTTKWNKIYSDLQTVWYNLSTIRLRGLALDIVMRYNIIINTYSIRCRTVITRLIKLIRSANLSVDKSRIQRNFIITWPYLWFSFLLLFYLQSFLIIYIYQCRFNGGNNRI